MPLFNVRDNIFHITLDELFGLGNQLGNLVNAAKQSRASTNLKAHKLTSYPPTVTRTKNSDNTAMKMTIGFLYYNLPRR